MHSFGNTEEMLQIKSFKSIVDEHKLRKKSF